MIYFINGSKEVDSDSFIPSEILYKGSIKFPLKHTNHLTIIHSYLNQPKGTYTFLQFLTTTMATPPLSSNLAAPLAPPLIHASRNPEQRGMYMPPDEAASAQLPRGSDQGGLYMPPEERRVVPYGPPRGNEPGMWSSPYDEGGRPPLPLRGSGQGLPLLPHGSSRPITSGGPEHGITWSSNQAMPMPIQPRVPERGGIFLTSDDHALARTVESYHRPDARDVNVRPLFVLVREIIDRCTAVEGASLANKRREATREGTFSLNGLQEVPELPLIVDRISSEITSRLLGGADAHNTTLSVLNMLQHFSWEAKVVLAMAAFALSYGDFWLLVQIYNKNPLAKSMALIKRLPMVMEHEGGLNQQFEATNNLISAMFETTQCIVEFGDLPANYISHEDPEVKAALGHFPIAVYWIIRSSVAVSAHITTICSSGAEYATATSQSWELSNWTHKLKNISNHLRETLSRLHRLIGEKRDIDAYKMIQKIVYKPMHVDNMEVLKALIPSDDAPLFDCHNKIRVHLEVLRNRTVLLLISDLNITQEELSVLELSNSEAKVHHQYEMVWIPVVEHSTPWTDAMQAKLESMQASMPWYSVHHPTLISGAVMKFIRNDWHFRGKPILVVLDQFGKVISPNAIHMMWIWQSHAFPFTSTREEDLWALESWRLELLVDQMDQKITDWIRADRYIFLYGGDDIEWIRRFTREAHAVARALEVQVEMVYVGRSHNKDVVRKVTEAINNEQLSHCWHDLTMIWYFWTRIESMIYSKFQTRRVPDDGDVILQEIQRLHSHDKSHGGWAILARGNRIVVHGHGKIALVTLQELEIWKQRAMQKGFDEGYGSHYHELHRKEFPCHRIEFPSNIKVPNHMLCPDCRRHMKNYNSFICCHEDDMIGSNQFTPALHAEG